MEYVKIKFSAAALAALLLPASACTTVSPSPPAYDAVVAFATEMQGDPLVVYFRNGDLNVATQQELPVYSLTEPGESESFGKAFPGAPPQVSHYIADLLPITGDENACLACHLPEDAPDYEAVPIPESHFMRAVIAGADGAVGPPEKLGARTYVQEYAKDEELVGARYNCVQCHTAQAENVRQPPNLFDRG